MTRRPLLADVRAHRVAIDQGKQDAGTRRMLAACRGELQVRIGRVVHGHDGKPGLPRTACGTRWIPQAADHARFPAGIPTEEDVDCMACIAAGASR